MLLDALKFGTSAQRRRFWSVQVRTNRSLGCIEFAGGRSVTDMFRTFRGLVRLCQRQPCGVEASLLPDEDPHVEQELLRRTAAGMDAEPEGGWVLKHARAYTQIRLGPGTGSPHDATT